MRPAPLYGGVSGPLVIAHRGGSLEAPENTLPAFEHGKKVGADWLELDVTLTSDGEVIVIHDDTLERTTDGEGEVLHKTLVELQRLEAGAPTWNDEQKAQLAAFEVTPPDFGATYAGTRLPTLAQVLALPDVRVMIEMKKIDSSRVRELAQKTLEVVRRAGAHDRVILGSFETDLLWAANDLDPSIALIGIGESSQEIEALLALPVTALAVRLDHVSEAREKAPGNVAVWAWTAWSPKMAEAAVAQGANGIITDVPAAVLAVLRKEPSLYVDDEPAPAGNPPASGSSTP